MASNRRSSLRWWIAGSGLLLVLCGFMPRQDEGERPALSRPLTFVGARLELKSPADLFSHAKHGVVPFDATVYDHGGFQPGDGRLQVPETGVYFVEANVSLRSQSPKLGVGPSLRMAIRTTSKVVAAASTTQLDDEKRTTVLATSTTCMLEKGESVFVDLATAAPDDPELKYPLVAPEKGADVCHLSIALLGRAPAGAK